MALGSNTEDEYNSFRSWLFNGSCIEQRMSSGLGQKPFKIPANWADVATMHDGGMELPDRFAEFEAMVAKDLNS